MIVSYYIVGTVPSPVNPLIDTLPHQVIIWECWDDHQYTTYTELKMNTCAAYGVINNLLIHCAADIM